ncbi:MAG: hypothetical protein ACRD15_03610, partial [Vicinamibacterales bacterium]
MPTEAEDEVCQQADGDRGKRVDKPAASCFDRQVDLQTNAEQDQHGRDVKFAPQLATDSVFQLPACRTRGLLPAPAA